MNTYISTDTDAFLALIEVMEITGENPHIRQLQPACYGELEKILNGAAPGFLMGVIIEGRKRAREEERKRANDR
jgi:hypothetical protein